jgi:hypothetical protein
MFASGGAAERELSLFDRPRQQRRRGATKVPELQDLRQLANENVN